MNMTELTSVLDALVGPYMAGQRWFGAADQTAPPRVVRVSELRPPWPALAHVITQAASGERYQLVFGLHPADKIADKAGQDLGGLNVALPEGDAMFVDATSDPESAIALFHVVCDEEVTTARPVTAEQSNTSIVYDERLIMKLFRRLSGRNPEIEMTEALARTGFTHIAEPVASWSDDTDDLALVQRFLVGGIEGWALALTSLRDFLDQGGDPGDAGGDMGPEAERLGEMTAELHLALAEAFGTAPGDADKWASSIARRAGEVDHPDLDRSAISAVVERVRTISDAGAAIRIHGDYHLGQVMRTDEGWYVLDFEGEPMRPVEERRQAASPLRDVASMLRSFSYAAAVGAREHGGGPDDEAASASWEQHNRSAFLAAYLGRLQGSPLLPSHPASTRQLLHALEMDKAIYEVGYEQAHRPDWVQIPLAAVGRLVATP